jgi:hypothetical protein
MREDWQCCHPFPMPKKGKTLVPPRPDRQKSPLPAAVPRQKTGRKESTPTSFLPQIAYFSKKTKKEKIFLKNPLQFAKLYDILTIA